VAAITKEVASKAAPKEALSTNVGIEDGADWAGGCSTTCLSKRATTAGNARTAGRLERLKPLSGKLDPCARRLDRGI
jgi:hypothetical protein